MSIFERLYRKLYTRVGGRPWTDIIRDEQKLSPLPFLLLFLFLGIGVVKLVGRRWWWLFLAFLFGNLIGHFWW